MREAVTSPRWVRVMAVTGTVLVVVSVASMLARGRSLEVLYARWIIHNAPGGVLGVWLAHLVLRRRPEHRAGRLMLAVGMVSCAHVALISLADARLVAAGAVEVGADFAWFVPADLPLDAVLPLWASGWLWIPIGTLALSLLLVLPDGRLPSPRWRWAVVALVVGTAVMCLAHALVGLPGQTMLVSASEPPFYHPVARVLLFISSPLLVVAAGATVAALVVRWRAADAVERAQLRPVVVAGVVLAVVLIGLWPWQAVWIPASLVTIWLFLIAYCFSIARYRLHDLDLVVSRTVVGAVLAALVTGAYLTIVVGVGSLVERSTQGRLLPLLAAGVVAVGFEPARRRVRRLVDRLLYARDRDAYEVLSGLAEHLRHGAGPDEVLDAVARLLVRGTGAARAEVALTVEERQWLAASWGSADGRLVTVQTMPVVHEGEALGEIRLLGRAHTDLAPDAQQLLEDVAGTLGVVLRNAHLTAELQAQVVELRRSRERLVHAHDEARRSLERDIHDGAQARLIALRLRLGLAAATAEAQGSTQLREQLESLGTEVDSAVRSLRTLAHGLNPPALDGGGVLSALRSESRGLPLPVTVEGEGIGRYDHAVEGAVYFSCLEAVQNAAKHGRARGVRITLSNGADSLDFDVSDDGVGFDPSLPSAGTGLANVRDRITALGGTLTIDAAPGRGTRIRGRVPIS